MDFSSGQGFRVLLMPLTYVHVGKAKTGEKAEFIWIYRYAAPYFEPVFNAVMAEKTHSVNASTPG